MVPTGCCASVVADYDFPEFGSEQEIKLPGLGISSIKWDPFGFVNKKWLAFEITGTYSWRCAVQLCQQGLSWIVLSLLCATGKWWVLNGRPATCCFVCLARH